MVGPAPRASASGGTALRAHTTRRETLHAGAERPVIYLDIDGVLLVHPNRRFARGIAAPGARAFLRWAVAWCEVRWLTAWTRNGLLPDEDLERLSLMLGVSATLLRDIEGLIWWDADKDDGIAWVEHLVRGRPFVWLEDGLLARELATLDATGLRDQYLYVNVLTDPQALTRAHRRIARRFGIPMALPDGTPCRALDYRETPLPTRARLDELRVARPSLETARAALWDRLFPEEPVPTPVPTLHRHPRSG